MGFRKISLAMVASLAFFLVGCDSPEQKEAKFIEQGNSYFEKGNFKKARIEYKNAAQLKPTAAEPMYKLGLVDEQEGDLRNAFANFMSAEQQDSHFHPASLKIAQYHMAAEQYSETRKRLETVLGENPNDAEAHALMAALLLREKKYEQAEEEALLALSKEPKNISAFSALTGIYAAQAKFDKAIETINKGISKNSKNLALHLLRVLIYEKMNDLTKVEEAYQSIFKLKPDEVGYRFSLAETLVKANRLDDAEKSLRSAMDSLPKNMELKHKFIAFLNKHRGMSMAETELKGLMDKYPDNNDMYLWLAELYMNAKATDKAVDLLNKLVKRENFDTPELNARNLLARISVTRGDRELAAKLVSVVLEKDPGNVSALLTRASMAFESGYYQNALSDLHMIMRVEPRNTGALQLLGETYLLQGNIDLAIDTMKKLVSIDPTNYAARVRLAQMVHLSGDTKQAMSLITFVTKGAPDYAIGWEAAARIALDDKQWLPAGEAIRTLDKIDGQHLTAVFLEGQLLQNTGKTDEAVKKFKETIEADTKAPLAEHALKALVSVYHKENHLTDALEYLEGLKSKTPIVWTLIGKCYATLGKPKEGANAFDKAIDADAAFPDPYIDRANLYSEEKKDDKALELLNKAALLAPNDFRAALTVASLLSKSGKYDEAIDRYEEILSRNPKLDVAANNMAELIADYKYDDKEALEKAKKAAERFSGSDNPYLLDTLSWVYYRLGRTDLAQTIMERAFRQNKPLPPQVHYHYGLILMKNGKVDKAKAEFEKAVTDDASYPGIEEAKKLKDIL